MKKVVWGEKRYYSSLKEDSFMNTKVGKEVVVDENYKYLTKNPIVKGLRFLFYYLFAVPICFFITKIKCSVKVKGRKNLKKLKGGAVLIGNHSNFYDGMFASVFVGFPKRNYFITNKDAVQIKVGRTFTKALGCLPLPDNARGLKNLSDSVDTLLKKGNRVTIYPEAAIWPYSTFLRPFPPAAFHYAVRSNVPVVPFAVTYRYAKRNPMKKRPKVNITILEPIYPDESLNMVERKNQLCEKTEKAIKEVVEREDNVTFIEYIQKTNE